jgi:hypothetical protein
MVKSHSLSLVSFTLKEKTGMENTCVGPTTVACFARASITVRCSTLEAKALLVKIRLA